MIKINKKKYLIIIGIYVFLSALLSPSQAATPIILHERIVEELIEIRWFIYGKRFSQTADVSLLNNGIEIEIERNIFAPEPSLSPCFLFLTDTSLSMGNELRESIVPLLNMIVDQKPSHYRYAIGNFDADVEILASFTTEVEELYSAIQKLEARGQRTELFRSSLHGLEILKECEDYRRVLILISDGDAEDLPGAYDISNVVQKANSEHMAIITIGVKDTIKMQNLQRIAEDAAGWHWLYHKNEAVNITRRIQETMDTGGELWFKISQLSDDNGELLLKLILSDGQELQKSINIDLPIYDQLEHLALPEQFPEQEYMALLAKIEMSLGKHFPNVPMMVWKVIVSALLFFALLSLLIVILRRRRKSKKIWKNSSAVPYENKKSFARIVSGRNEFVINKKTISIGAVAENDIIINEEAVGRYQATIDYKDGKFFLTDRGATNTSLVNDKVVRHHELKDGDKLSFGHWQGIFKL